MKTETTETSVMFALAELQRSEVVRQAEEVATRQQKEREARERAEREREQRREAELQAQRVAEAAARLRVEVEAREAAARERVAAMQQAFIQLKAERDVLQGHLQRRDSETAGAGSSAGLRWAMGGMAMSLVAVAGMAIVLLTTPVRARIASSSGVHVEAPKPLAPPPAAPLPGPQLSAGAPSLLPTPPVAPARPKPRPHTPVHTPVAQPDPAACGDDPICGMKFK